MKANKIFRGVGKVALLVSGVYLFIMFDEAVKYNDKINELAQKEDEINK